MLETQNDREATMETGHPWISVQVDSWEHQRHDQVSQGKRVGTPRAATQHLASIYNRQEASLLCEIDAEKSFVMWYGTTPRVTIMEPNLIKEILNKKSGDFPKPELNSFTELYVTGLASYNEDKWAKHRKIVNPACNIENLKQMLPAFVVCTEELIVKWNKLANFMGSCEVDVSVEFQNLAGDAISRAAFGRNYEEGRLIFLPQKEQGRLFSQSQTSINFPLLRFLPTKVNKRMKHIHKEVQTLLTGIIEKREKSTRPGDHKDDLLGLLLNSNLNEVQEKKDRNAGMTKEDVMEECKLFYFAGVQLFIPLHLVHRDAEQWGEDAMEFNPERFSEGIFKATKGKISYFPLGWGPRICDGQNFAMLESKLAMAKILQNFSFQLSPTYTHAPFAAVTLQPQYGAQIILHKL
ncbi:hypothetical protein DITRI_Ditri01bG0124400 [Diplodiscus trichospermus]